jgi:hypothetical protein
MTILKAGSFRVADYRKTIAAKVKQAVIAREFDFDHDPALVNRDYDTEAGDFIPPQNDPKHIIARRKAEHLEKTIGRKEGAEKTVSTRGSDVGEAARSRDIQVNEAIFRAAMASKAGRYNEAAKILAGARKNPKLRQKLTRPKRKIPSRPFPKQQRPFKRRSA